ncbi:tigger transposable element-derived protein 4-like [Rhizophagus irregularis DAOM 181602=DAOM 197198]|nr:tigger transposable element-derived protein 4-like [Rhizophagus irregularis DAOM 181602=DAOM 197198]
MQASVLNGYLKKLDSQMRTQGRNIILLVDNAPAHSLYETINLTNIKIEFLSPDTTAHIQPCDQEIINSFKKLLLRNRVKAFDNYNEYGIKPNNVTQSTIENCWLKADILPKDDEIDSDLAADEFVQYDNSGLTAEMIPVEEILKAVLPGDNQENEIEALDFNPLDFYHQLLIVKQLNFITK